MRIEMEQLHAKLARTTDAERTGYLGWAAALVGGSIVLVPDRLGSDKASAVNCSGPSSAHWRATGRPGAGVAERCYDKDGT